MQPKKNLIFFFIISVKDNNFFKLGNTVGTLPQFYTRNQFTVCPGKLIDVKEISQAYKSLRKIVNVLSFRGLGSRVLKCVCKGQCKNNKCKYKALQVNFVTQNNNSLSCDNK